MASSLRRKSSVSQVIGQLLAWAKAQPLAKRIAMPRPRDSASAEFNALKKELSKRVMDEQMRYTETEIKGYTAD